MGIIWFRKRVVRAPGPAGTEPRQTLRVRAFRDPDDRSAWLRLQNEAFRRPRPWSEREFERELSGRPDWEPARLLVAEWPDAWLRNATGPASPAAVSESQPMAGSVYLELPPTVPIVRLHWLAVHGSLRRQGVARGLVDQATERTRRASRDWLVAETLADWQDAVGFYESLGFVAGPPGQIPEQE